MRSDAPLDYAVFQLSPRRSRCELFVSGSGTTEKLASGLLKPFLTHLTVAEEQARQAVQSIKLEIEKLKNDGTWFTKGTLERFVRFVSTPEVLELVNTFDAEMSQLEAARRIYLQVLASVALIYHLCRKELLRAIDVRLGAVRQDLTTACARAAAAGFTPDTVSELQLFANRFGAHRLNEACTKFISVNQRRPDLINPWATGRDDHAIRSSSGSDMSIDDSTEENVPVRPNGSHHNADQSQYPHQRHQQNQPQTSQEHDVTQHHEHSGPSTFQQPKTLSTFPIQRSLRESSSERDEGIESEGTIEKEEIVNELPKTSQHTRRLSVQDRINMFENKQKEQSRSSGGKVVVAKSAELRRLPSDVSSAGQPVEKAVLRRWSGASDMSMDLSNERRETESSESTPGPTSDPQSQTPSSVYQGKDIGGSQDTATSSKAEFRGLPVSVEDSGLKDRAFPHNQVGGFPGSEDALGSKSCWSEAARLNDKSASQPQIKAFSGRTKEVLWKDETPSETPLTSSPGAADVDFKGQAASQSRFGSFSGGKEQSELKNEAVSQTLRRAPSGGAELALLKDQAASQSQFRTIPDHSEDVGLNNQTTSQAHFRASASRVADVGPADEPYQVPRRAFPSRSGDVRVRDELTSQAPTRASPTTLDIGSDSKETLVSELQTRAFSGKVKGGSGAKNQSASMAQYRDSEGDLSAQQIQWGFQGKIEEAGKMQFGGFPAREEDSGLQGVKLQRQSSAPEQNSKFRGRRGDSNPIYGNIELDSEKVPPVRKVIEGSDTFDSVSTAVTEQVQKGRTSKGNQDLNDELQMKADELEKLFAAHKLRVPGDQSTTSRRSKPAEMRMEQAASAAYRKPVEVSQVQLPAKATVRESAGSSGNVAKLDVNPLMRMVDNHDYGNALKQNISELVFPEDSRGKFYDKYMQKRNAKLREEWSSRRAQKEAKMKAMQDSLERSRAEMEAKFAESAERRDSPLYARQRAEKLRSFNVRSVMKNREQAIEFLIEGDEDLSGYSEQTQYEQDGSFNETFLGDGSSRSVQSKKHLPNRNQSSSTSRISAAPVPRSSTKSSNSSSGRRRAQPENPLTQSVPNFSDFRKENTKPSSGISKTTSRTQIRNYTRSKSTIEDIPLVKEDKPQRCQSMRKSFAVPGELKDLSPLNSDGVVLAQLKFAKEQVEQSLYNKVPKNGESKPFLKKGNGIGPGAGAGIAKMKYSVAPENLKTEEESDDLADQLEDSIDMVKEEEEEESEREMVEGTRKAVDYLTDSDNEKPGMIMESEKSGDPELGNGEVLRSLCEVDHDSVAELAAAVPSKFHTSVGHAQDSPGESPVSWNSHVHHPFSYIHESSDIDASIDSPMGSPASWNSHSLTQLEVDAARMRKKWGSAQKPILVANSSQHQSRKDVAKGFKRLLKFGRKSRGTESLVDWISATTSEGDDDTDDGRDVTNRSSDDLRKSRMGLSQDALNDSDLFNEQVK
ncbi:hypothetical protein BVC80_1799g59 [Macleaya cordata]|uniref:Uncharacterized protein n=1 Tax=Macleaya cordata TaxID=56857 RepID=A0A200QPJ6_MACCD|nr:hypothetical protein BVC80_1799g59 [Macleaya cordata]